MRRLNAFTLIEMMVALALSAAIMLLAFSAFRLCSSAIQTMNRMVAENDLLRRGAVICLDTIDTWADQAEPAYPWGKVYNSFQEVDKDGLPVSAASDHANNKRSFRKVEFAVTGNFNPNWVGPHDPRAWYRNHLSPSPRPHVVDGGNGAMYWPNGLYGGTPYSGSWNMPSSDIPPGWEARHVWGDYSLVSNLGMDPTDSADGTRGARPNLMMDLFVELGLAGVVGYMPAGTQTLILMPNSNLAARALDPTNPANFHSIGELPLSTVTFRDPTSGNEFGGTLSGYLDRYVRSVVTIKVPTTDPAYPYTPSISVLSGRLNRASYHEALQGYRSSTSPGWGFDLDQRFDRFLLYGNAHIFTGSSTWSRDQINLATRSPFQALDLRTNNWSIPAIQDQWIRNFGNVLYLVPQSYANNPSPDLTKRPRNLPSMSLSMLRFRWRSGEFHNSVLRVVNPETGQILQMGIYATGSTFRGARQHWALASDDQATPATFDPTMGDVYR